jgi:hypothetical protein
VHSSKFLVPAKFASSSLSIFKILLLFFTLDERPLCNFIFSFALAFSIIFKKIGDFKIEVKYFSDKMHLEPKLDSLFNKYKIK